MHAQSGLPLDYDLGSLTVLMIGIGAVALLAFSGFLNSPAHRDRERSGIRPTTTSASP
jgi:hypothetical protein